MTLTSIDTVRNTSQSARPMRDARSYTDEIRTLALRARRGETLTEDQLAHLAALVAGRTWPAWNPGTAYHHHYKHVTCLGRWPSHTTLAAYEWSIRRVVLHPDTSIVLNVVQTAEMPEPEFGLTFHGATLPSEKGPNGGRYTVFHYSLDAGCWRTCYQVDEDVDAYVAAEVAAGRMKEILWL